MSHTWRLPVVGEDRLEEGEDTALGVKPKARGMSSGTRPSSSAMPTRPRSSQRLLEPARIAATPMTVWGKKLAPRYVRLVYSNEPVDRLRGVGTGCAAL